MSGCRRSHGWACLRLASVSVGVAVAVVVVAFGHGHGGGDGYDGGSKGQEETMGGHSTRVTNKLAHSDGAWCCRATDGGD